MLGRPTHHYPLHGDVGLVALEDDGDMPQRGRRFLIGNQPRQAVEDVFARRGESIQEGVPVPVLGLRPVPVPVPVPRYEPEYESVPA